MGASHARQRRPLFPLAWSVKSLADSLRVDRTVIYAALRNGDLIAYKITGQRNLILTGSADEPGTVIHWIKSHRRKRYEHA
jgi:hypothetical protein